MSSNIKIVWVSALLSVCLDFWIPTHGILFAILIFHSVCSSCLVFHWQFFHYSSMFFLFFFRNFHSACYYFSFTSALSRLFFATNWKKKNVLKPRQKIKSFMQNWNKLKWDGMWSPVEFSFPYNRNPIRADIQEQECSSCSM